ncbi:MAG: PD-(D/E)XK nuclease family protein [Aeromicrobium sp.]|nr:PD-(D/E)XK nuclease family protein [Burkholderiales bacterium]
MRSNTAHLPPSVIESLAAEGVTVVTPNRRLAAALKRVYDAAQQQAGRRAWVAPDILPLPTFLARTVQAIRLGVAAEFEAAVALPKLIDVPQSHLLWEQVIRQSDASDALLSIPQTAEQAAAAWSVANQWRLLDAMRTYPLHEDGQVFFGWAIRYQRLCREMQVMDLAVLPDVLANVLVSVFVNARSNGLRASGAGALVTQTLPDGVLPRRLLTAGFDIVTPQIAAFFATCSSAGVDVEALFAGDAADVVAGKIAETRRLVFANDTDELRACAAWARAQLEHRGDSDNTARLAVVVPDLQKKRHQISRFLTDALAPLARARMHIGAEASSLSALFNISLGLPLNEYGLVNDAIELIDFSQGRPLPFARFSTLLRSPFIGAAEREIAARARLDAQLREMVASEVSLTALQKLLKLGVGKRLISAVRSCPEWVMMIDRVAGLPTASKSFGVASNTVGKKTSESPRRSTNERSPFEWSRHFTQALSAWGFPGERALGSSDFQVLAKFRDALETLAALENVQPRMRADEALAQLRRIVGDTVFQPESAGGNEAPIQVLGILESAGQSFDPFDAMWVTGLSDDAWPLAARPNPFIPAALQRLAGVTEASAAASLALDKRITEGWQHSARELILSHAMYQGADADTGQARPASALISDFPLDVTAPVAQNYAECLQQSGALSARLPIPDVAFAALATLATPAAVSGGSGIIRDQAACPFRAFARHRLSAKPLAEPTAGLDAAARGTLLHRVLSLVWKRLQTQTAMLVMQPEALAGLVGDAAHQAINEIRADGADMLTGRFAALEHARLCQVVTAWLAVERERAPFDVVACEEARHVEISGLSMRLQLDRLDQLHDGSYALIDYKTGVAQVKGWLGERPDEPQLPLYLHTAEQEISALAFARLKRGKTFGFEGVSATDNVLPNVTPIEQKRGMSARGYVSWDVLVRQWEAALNRLATQFVNGIAVVDPKHGGLTCAQCELQSVCRVAEVTGQRGDEVACGGEGGGDGVSYGGSVENMLAGSDDGNA